VNHLRARHHQDGGSGVLPAQLLGKQERAPDVAEAEGVVRVEKNLRGCEAGRGESSRRRAFTPERDVGRLPGGVPVRGCAGRLVAVVVNELSGTSVSRTHFFNPCS
jgi:hypothetical protein